MPGGAAGARPGGRGPLRRGAGGAAAAADGKRRFLAQPAPLALCWKAETPLFRGFLLLLLKLNSACVVCHSVLMSLFPVGCGRRVWPLSQ